MKQAILITAYKNYEHLKHIINFFDYNFNIYIHIDKKSNITEDELEDLNESKIVKLISQKFKVNWGSFNHLQCILYLAEQALSDSENYYFHLITGQDFPIKKVNVFIDFFKKNNEINYMNYFEFPKKGWADNGGVDRLFFFNFYDLFNAKIPKQNRIIRKIVGIQKKIGIKRKMPINMPKIFGGSTYWSLSRDCLDYVINYGYVNKRNLKRFKYTLCSEEFYFQTVIMNSKFDIVNNSLRHIDWVARNGNNPALLDESDFYIIMKSDAFFARKFDSAVSKTLFENIKKELI